MNVSGNDKQVVHRLVVNLRRADDFFDIKGAVQEYFSNRFLFWDVGTEYDSAMRLGINVYQESFFSVGRQTVSKIDSNRTFSDTAFLV